MKKFAMILLAAASLTAFAADTAVKEQRMTMAEQFADESRVEAELASAKTADVKARAVNEEMTRSNGTLIEEMQRNSGDKP